VIEHQVDAVVLAALSHTELAGLETEATPELQQESLDVVQQGRLELLL
jgi:hypothetical protein